MANPQPSDAHLRIAHSILEQLMCSNFTEQQRRVLDLILRLSWGCGKKCAEIPYQKDFGLVGVRESHVKRHIDWLIEARVINREANTYSFNKDFDQWRVSRALGYSPDRLTELVSLNLNHLRNMEVDLQKTEVNLRNMEVETYGKRKNGLTENVSLPDTNSASLYKILKKVINKELSTDIILPGGEVLEAGVFWQRIKTALEGRLAPSNYKTWVEPISAIGINENVFYIAVPSAFQKEALEKRLAHLIVKELENELKKPFRVEFILLAEESKTS